MRLRWFIAAAALALFVWLAWVVSQGAVPPFDSAVREAVNRCSSPLLTAFMWSITYLGSEWVLTPVTLLAVVVLWRSGRRRDAILLGAAIVGAETLSNILKVVFHRVRATSFFGYQTPGTYSFPSGHAMVSCCFYVTLAGIARRGPALQVAAALLAVLVGFSRIYLGVHYPTDVIAGFAAGVVWTIVVQRMVTSPSGPPGPSRW